MVGNAACRGTIARFAAAFAAACVVIVTPVAAQEAPAAPPKVYGPPAPKPPRDAESAAAKAKELVDPIKRCKPGEDGAIEVCGSDTDRHRLSPELRAIAGIGTSTKDSIPHQPVSAMTLDRLPYNWVSIGGRMKPGPEYNHLYEMAKRATDPDTGVPPPPAEEEP
ncbi:MULTISPECIES: hypothetical protein [unclassified Sphingopyxis]|uniref:hypothetical protein n=1 Tax=unclassified Sphingopyxis TaxID=2614943 RepID=UPI00073699FD|nr:MULTISPECIES: hypothetical protein [unclassified Sphingopyxis]KTE46397.1 hypothetical protein ATE62_00170 [Sphingopyxis sp. HIX]KTE85000.1 hypothetical protein ATE72_05775 [Sphingopyxis sp. HXXIV]